jgi:hypothetical protein
VTPVESTSAHGVESFTPLPPIVESVDQPEMDDEELTRLESVIERGHQTFIEVGEALLSIRERKDTEGSGFQHSRRISRNAGAGVASAGIN